MKNVKINLRLNKILDIKEYLRKKAQMNKEFDKYVNNVIQKAEQSIEEGRVRPIRCILEEVEKEYGLMRR